MTIKTLEDGTSFTKAHAHDWENPECTLRGHCKIYIKIDGHRAIRNKSGVPCSRNSLPISHISHLAFKDAEIFCGSWSATQTALTSTAPPVPALTQENVYELSDGNIDKRLYLGFAENPSNKDLEQLMLKMLELKHEGLIVRCQDKKGRILWWKIVPYRYADVKITGMKEGKGKNKGMCGSVQSNWGNAGSICDGSVPNVSGDGPTRKWLWEHRHEIIGKCCMQVRYRETTEAGKFRFSSLVRLRTDKNEESFD